MDDFLAYMMERSLGLYRNTSHGTILVRLTRSDALKREGSGMTNACHDRPVAVITEHRLFDSRQHTLQFDRDLEVAINLPAGDYTVVVSAPG